MIDPKDNPPAFPTGPQHQANGMTLLDYFAAKAIQTAKSNCMDDFGKWSDDCIASKAYDLAEAMLAERKKRMETN